MPVPHQRLMSRNRMLRFLEELENASGITVSLCFPPGVTETEIEELIDRASGLPEMPSDLVNLIRTSKTGAAIFWGEQNRCMVIPPFPIVGKQACDGYHPTCLSSLLQHDLLIALVLVRLGDYAIGVFRGEEFLTGKVGTGLVHSRHRKGGSSQRRFERHREKQMESFFIRVCGHVRAQLEPYALHLDYIFYGGERNTLLNFRKQCRFLEQFDSQTMGNVLNVRRPRQADLKESIAQVWSSQLIEWKSG